jgi:hypothetical protein
MPPKDNSERACEECIHYWACSRQCSEPMAQRSATGCECYETVKSIAAARLIERLTAENAALREKVPQWISVEDRLPEVWINEEDDVLVNYMIYSQDFGVDIGNYHANAKRWLCMAIPCTVTHWMPLPEAPEEGDKA